MKDYIGIIFWIIVIVILIFGFNSNIKDSEYIDGESYYHETEELKEKISSLEDELSSYKNWYEDLQIQYDNLKDEFNSTDEAVIELQNQLIENGIEPIIPIPEKIELTDSSNSTQDEKSSWEKYKEQRQAEENIQLQSHDTIEEISELSSISQEYVLNTNTHKFHKSSCSSVSQMKESNTEYFSGTRDEVISKGYEPCKRCNP